MNCSAIDALDLIAIDTLVFLRLNPHATEKQRMNFAQVLMIETRRRLATPSEK